MNILNKTLTIIGLQSFFILSASAIDPWDPQLYADHSTVQHDWAKTALKTQRAKKILDVGCGHGRITLEIAKENPDAFVLGLDLSANMIAYANIHNKAQNLIFTVGDAEALHFKENFDRIYSFSALHRLKKPEAALKGIYEALKPNGSFTAAFPIKGSALYSQALARVDGRDKWSKYLGVKERKDYAKTDEEWRTMLIDAGFLVLSIEEKARQEQFATREAFRDFLRCTSVYRALLPQDVEITFFEEVVDEYLKVAPVDEKGFINLYLSRVEIHAIKWQRPAKI